MTAHIGRVVLAVRRLTPMVLFAWMCNATAADTPPSPWRDLPFYPGFYTSAGVERDARDQSFDHQGGKSNSALPTVPGKTAFPESRVALDFSWYFPLFETYGLPYISDHLFTSRVGLGYQHTRTTGALESFIASNPDIRPATNGGASGLEDVRLEFGSFILGGQNWRTKPVNHYALLALLGIGIPTGRYDHTGPVSPGSNAFSWSARLGFYAQPWNGGFVDAGAGARWHASDADPMFGHLAPRQQGTDRTIDLTFTQRLAHGLYLGVFASDRKGAANIYEDVKYAPNAPAPPSPAVGGTSRSYPTPGEYRDGGTALRSVGGSLEYFITQRWMFSAHYTHPLSGRSGQFQLPFTDEQCAPGGATGGISCSQSAGETRLQDGLGPARSYASGSWMLMLSYKFDDEDLFPCIGCAD